MTIASASFRELRLNSVSRIFGGISALKDLSLSIGKGEFIALLGPSGCGKSTALNCLAGLLPLSSGTIMLDERRIDPLRPEERGFGMVFQNYALFPHMSVRRNIGFGLKMRRVGATEAARRVDEVLRLVRLEAHAEKLPGQLSGGQQQRVAIARAIVIEPALVLMDEPLSNLDAKLRLEMRQEIRRIHDTIGTTTIYVTHDQDEALSMADRVVVLREGQLRQVGTPRELYSAPSSVDVAEFMGYRNQLSGKLLGQADGGAEVSLCDSRIMGRIGGRASGRLNGSGEIVACIRPDDLHPSAAGIPATIEAVEYRGREYFGKARGPGGEALYFSADHAPAPGQTVALAADPDRVLVFAAGTP